MLSRGACGLVEVRMRWEILAKDSADVCASPELARWTLFFGLEGVGAFSGRGRHATVPRVQARLSTPNVHEPSYA